MWITRKGEGALIEKWTKDLRIAVYSRLRYNLGKLPKRVVEEKALRYARLEDIATVPVDIAPPDAE